ncbi:TauD/TfdA dioxygenase family protein [Streptosporangium sp. CA-135522]|uniref:TauD/TfdA dioxygenase family protein n=1 Tax=Streptosporangium sp. CA-135522 TaxID=3240072 RepID=UPI003D8E6CC7
MDLRVKPMTPACGAEVFGADLAGPPAAVARSLRPLLLRHGVLVFHEQATLTPEAQIALARCFGHVTALPSGLPGHPEIARIDHGVDAPPTENVWHSDMSFLSHPPMGALLRAVVLPPVGGDTLFADMRTAWRRLPDRLKEIVRELSAEHDIAKCAPAGDRGRFAGFPPVVHPLMRTHPETGEEILFANPAYTTRVVGVPEAEGAALLNRLFRMASVPEIQCRVRWAERTVVLWDNRSLQHYAVADYLPARRIMDRVSIA